MRVSVTRHDEAAAFERPGAEAGHAEISGLDRPPEAVVTVGLRCGGGGHQAGQQVVV